MVMMVVCSVLMMVFMGLLVRSEYTVPRRYLWKTLASAMFVLMGIFVFVQSGTMAALWIMIAFLFAMGGDVSLAVHDTRGNKPTFALGIAFFACTQCLYAAALCGLYGFSIWAAVIALVVAAISVAGIFVFKMDVKPFFLLIVAYSLVLCFAFGCAVMSLIQSFSTQTVLFAAGMTLFLLSDINLLFKYFKKDAKRCTMGVVQATYFAAQMLIAWGAFLL